MRQFKDDFLAESVGEADVDKEERVEKQEKDYYKLTPGKDVLCKDDTHHTDADPEEADGVANSRVPAQLFTSMRFKVVFHEKPDKD